MRRSVFLGAVVVFSGAVASVGCGKQEAPAAGAPAPAPETTPKPGAAAPEQVSYDPSKPEIKIDWATFSSALPPNDPFVPDWKSKNGKVAEVSGVMGSVSANPQTGREAFMLRADTGKGAIGCELMALPDWRQAGPGRRLKVVGVLDVKDHGQRGIDIRLNHATIVSVSGEKTIPEFTAEQIGKEYAADRAGFDKKWKAEDKFYYVTGTLTMAEEYPLTGGGVAHKMRVSAGPVDLYCHLLNGRGVEADRPKPGDKVVLLVECQGYSQGFEAVSMNGLYAGKAP